MEFSKWREHFHVIRQSNVNVVVFRSCKFWQNKIFGSDTGELLRDKSAILCPLDRHCFSISLRSLHKCWTDPVFKTIHSAWGATNLQNEPAVGRHVGFMWPFWESWLIRSQSSVQFIMVPCLCWLKIEKPVPRSDDHCFPVWPTMPHAHTHTLVIGFLQITQSNSYHIYHSDPPSRNLCMYTWTP